MMHTKILMTAIQERKEKYRKNEIVFDDMIADMIGVRKLKVGLSRLRKFFPNLNFLQSCLLKKIPSFVCFVTKIENK